MAVSNYSEEPLRRGKIFRRSDGFVGLSVGCVEKQIQTDVAPGKSLKAAKRSS